MQEQLLAELASILKLTNNKAAASVQCRARVPAVREKVAVALGDAHDVARIDSAPRQMLANCTNSMKLNKYSMV